MAKYTKCAVDTPKKNAKYPSYRVKNDPKYVKPIVQVDADVVPGAEFYAETKWLVPGSWSAKPAASSSKAGGSPPPRPGARSSIFAPRLWAKTTD